MSSTRPYPYPNYDLNPLKKVQMEYKADCQDAQRRNLLSLLQDDKFSDVTFIVGDDKVPFHVNRMFLASVSPSFKALLYGQMEEAQKDSTVCIEDIGSAAFECIISFAYGNNPNVSGENLLPLIKACDKYLISSLFDVCCDYLKSCLDADNFHIFCFQAIDLRIFPRIQEIMQQHFAAHYMVCLNEENFHSFFNKMFAEKLVEFMKQCQLFLEKSKPALVYRLMSSKHFEQLPLQAMRVWLAANVALCEEQIWESLIMWATFQAKEDDQQVKGWLRSVSDLVRFGLMSGKYFTAKVYPLDVLTADEALAIYAYSYCPARGCGSFETNPRQKHSLLYVYTLRMSSQSEPEENSYEALTSDDATRICRTISDDTDNPKEAWIEARFQSSTCVKEIEIGAPGAGGWSGGELQFLPDDDGKWKTLLALRGFKAAETRRVKLKETVVAVRVWAAGSGRVSAAKLKVFC